MKVFLRFFYNFFRVTTVGFVKILVCSIVVSNIDGVLNMNDSNSSSINSDKKMF